MTIIVPANSAADTGYSIDNSCRFNGDAHLSKTPGSAGSTTTGTLSWWMKYDVATDSGGQYIYTNKDGSNKQFIVRFHNKALKVDHWNGSGYDFQKATSMLFRDPSAWYHICIKIDTGNGTAANRIKLFVNGTNVGWDADDDTVTEDFDGNFFINASTQIGDTIGDGADFKGYLAEFVGIDGTAYDADSFGEFNEDSPNIWQPIDVSGLTFGTNGFWLDFEDSSNLGNDKNGGTDWSETSLAAADQALDSPTNNFCTMNPLDNYGASSTFSEGNCKVAIGTNDRTNTATMGLSAGKWYFECKYTPGSQVYSMIGIINYAAGSINSTTSGYLGIDAAGNWYYEIGGGGTSTSNELRASENNSATNVAPYPAAGSASTEIASGDIIQVAIDLDNNKIWWGKNNSGYFGTDGYNGVPADGTNGYTIAAPSTINGGAYFPAAGRSDSGGVTWEFNFGGCSAFTVSSGNADGNGYGNFEYAPPSGFLAICTKNLGSDGG
jgi:hypothetical protein